MFEPTDWREIQALLKKLFGEGAHNLYTWFWLCPRCRKYSLTINSNYHHCSNDCQACTVEELQAEAAAVPEQKKVVKPTPPPKPPDLFYEDLVAQQKDALLDALQEIFDEDFGSPPPFPVTLRQMDRQFEGKILNRFPWWPYVAIRLGFEYDPHLSPTGRKLICPFRLLSRDDRKKVWKLHNRRFNERNQLDWRQFNIRFSSSDLALLPWWPEIQAELGWGGAAEDAPKVAAGRKAS